jgi:hypothetical protein
MYERNGTRRPRKGKPASSPPTYGMSSPNFAERTSSEAKHELRTSSSRMPGIIPFWG